MSQFSIGNYRRQELIRVATLEGQLRLPFRPLHFLLLLCFWFSGATALIYEVLWMRQFTDRIGSTSLATSLILTAFMGGMALGAHLARIRAPQFYNRLQLYGLPELGIGLYALSSPLWFGLLDQFSPLMHTSDNFLTLLSFRFALASLLLIVPTACMGATLPVLLDSLTRRPERSGQASGLLYGMNTLGAVAGTLLAGFWLLATFGLRSSVAATALINLLVGGLVLILANNRVETEASALQAPVRR